MSYSLYISLILIISCLTFIEAFKPLYSNKFLRQKKKGIHKATFSDLSYNKIQTNTAKSDRFTDLLAVDLNLLDLFDILSLSLEEFGQNCTPAQKLDLQRDILALFVPKVVIPYAMGHHLRGLKDKTTGKLLGFVDLSLQPNDGTLDALKPTTIQQRSNRYKDSTLSPYLCNLLVAPEARGRGLGRLLVKECERRALELGYNDIHLHCESQSSPALRLYNKSGFNPIRKLKNGSLLFMRKVIEQ